MQLNINSLSAQLYRWFYSMSQMPQSLCPYFWKLALMWLVIFPYAVLSIPVMLMDRKDPEHRTTAERAGIGFVIYFILFMLFSMISWTGLLFAEPGKDTAWFHMLVAGGCGWVVSIIFGSIALFKWSREKWETRHVKYDKDGYRIWEPIKEKQPSIITEFVKAKYNKYCPKIDWTSKNS
jgi:hypothetical protein